LYIGITAYKPVLSTCGHFCLPFQFSKEVWSFWLKRAWRMLKRAFSTTNHHHQYHQGTPRWKVRLCYGFLILIFITFAIILIAWNMLCALPNTNPLLVSVSESTCLYKINFSGSNTQVNCMLRLFSFRKEKLITN